MEERKNRVVRVMVTDFFLKEHFKEGRIVKCTKGIPEEAEFRGYSQDVLRNCLWVFFTHKSFDEVPESRECPEYICEFTDETHSLQTMNERNLDELRERIVQRLVEIRGEGYE